MKEESIKIETLLLYIKELMKSIERVNREIIKYVNRIIFNISLLLNF